MTALRWLFVRIESPSELESDLLAEGLVAAGAGGVEQRGATLEAWLPARADGDGDAQVAGLCARLADALGHAPQLWWEWRPDEDWALEWRRGLLPRRVGARLIVAPTWTEPDAAADDIVIRVDPQMAFGTGEHATTRGVLALMEQAVTPGAHVLDVGTGSAILAIAAVMLGAAGALAVDDDPDALINAAENLAGNGVEDRVALREARVDLAFLETHAGRFDLIVANVLSGVLRPLLPGFHDALRPGGRLILSGILQEEAAVMRASATGAGFSVVQELAEEEWWTVLLAR